MKIFYLDTSSDYLYSGIVIDNRVVSEVKEKLGKDMSKLTLPKIIKVFQDANISPNELDKIVVVIGPGSFTGIRIGVTIAKTIAWSLNIPIIPISGLTAMAISFNESNHTNYIMPLIDARRGYVYGALYDNTSKAVIADTHILLTTLEENSKAYHQITVVTNNDLKTPYDTIKYDPDILAITTYFKDDKGVNPHTVNPIYLKKTEAEEKANL